MITDILRSFWRLIRSRLSALMESKSYCLSLIIKTEVFQCIHKADVFEFGIDAHFLEKGIFNVQVSNIVRQYSHLVTVDFVLILVGQTVLRQVFNQFSNKSAGARSGVENFHVLVAKTTTKMLIGQIISCLNHESHYFIWRVDDTQAVSPGRIISFVEILIYHLEEALLLMMVINIAGGGFNNLNVWVNLDENVLANCAGKEGLN